MSKETLQKAIEKALITIAPVSDNIMLVIADPASKDELVPFPCTNSASLDVECKRVFFDGGMNSRPPRDIAEVMKIRNEILKLHKQNKQASPAALQALFLLNEARCKLSGSTKQKVLRMLLVSIVRGVHAWHRGRRSYEELAEIFDMSLATVKRYKKSPYFQVAPDNAHYRQIVREYAAKVEILHITQQMYHCILYPV